MLDLCSNISCLNVSAALSVNIYFLLFIFSFSMERKNFVSCILFVPFIPHM